jgi:hypothetical protein
LLLRALERDELHVPRDTTAPRLRGLLNKLGRQQVNVRIQDPYRHGDGVATYLARYFRGGPLSNGRLISMRDGEVTFRCRGRRRAGSVEPGPPRQEKLQVEKFLWRYLQHVPPKGFTMVRRYGIYTNSKTKELNAARLLLGQEPWIRPERPKWQEVLAALDPDQAAAACCPVCGSVLLCQRLPYHGRSPPIGFGPLPQTQSA